MATIIKNGELVSLADGNETEFHIESQDTSKDTLIYLEVVTSASGIRFASGESIVDAKHRAWPATAKFPMTVNNKTRSLRGKGLAAETFVATW